MGCEPVASDPAGRAMRWSRGALEYLGECPVCASRARMATPMSCSDHRGSMASDYWWIQRCRDCRTLYLDPRPDAMSMSAAYEAYYTHSTESETTPDKGAGGILWGLIHGYVNARFGLSRKPSYSLGRLVFAILPPWRLKLDYYGRHLFADAYPDRGRLLDVGCGNGAFLARAAAMGWSVTGLEPDPKATAACREQGLDVIEGTLATLACELEDSFDVITLSHSIEHVADPREALLSVASFLKDGGRLWMALPNPKSIGAWFFRGCWRELHPPYHLCIPDQKQLTNMLRNAGFEEIRLLRRGAHARRMMRESAENARATGDATMRIKARLAPALRVVADIAATLMPYYGEETIILAKRSSRL